ncbi:uncharacterized protein KRP23_4810 [Phytophthora ramorum]|nr:hypothetical protein KRP23_4810 [Phytophthora ramorum]
MGLIYVVVLALFVSIAGRGALGDVADYESLSTAAQTAKFDPPGVARSFADHDDMASKRLLRSTGTIIDKDDSVDSEERAITIPGLDQLKSLVKKGSSKVDKLIELLKYKFWLGIGKTDNDINKLWAKQGKSTGDIYKLWLKLGKTDEDIFKMLRADEVYKIWVRQGKSTDDIYSQLLKFGKGDEDIYRLLVKQGVSTNAIFTTWEKQGKSTTDTLRIWRSLGKKDEDIYKIWLQQGKSGDEINKAWLYVYKRPDDVYRLLKIHHVDPRDSANLNQYIQYRTAYNDMLGISNL